MSAYRELATRRLSLSQRYRLVWKRRRLLWRALRSRHALSVAVDRTGAIQPDDILAVLVVRNEVMRLPYFLSYYRDLGVSHFLIVDNESSDGTVDLLQDQADVSLWQTRASYRDARFGLDWANWLLMRYGHGHWCLLLDADELLVYAHSDSRDLHQLTEWLASRGQEVFGALLLDMYPKTPLGERHSEAQTDPIKELCWYHSGPYRTVRQMPMGNLWVQGGLRERVFFADDPRHSPTLNKLPLIRWNRRWAFVNSSHSILPAHLNQAYDGPGGIQPAGVLLHTKFMPEVLEKSAEDRIRKQHFHQPEKFAGYYDKIMEKPILWEPQSEQYEGWKKLQQQGLLQSGGF